MSTTRQSLATIASCATVPSAEHQPRKGEAQATHALVYAAALAETEPFAALHDALTAFFDGDIDAALREDETAALAEADRIIGDHVRLAQVRLSRPTPVIDWSDHIALTEAMPAVARRAADLELVQILGTPAIAITVDGQAAETIGQAAARRGMDVGTLTTRLRRSADVSPVARLDARTPLYRCADVDLLVDGRRTRPVSD